MSSIVKASDIKNFCCITYSLWHDLFSGKINQKKKTIDRIPKKAGFKARCAPRINRGSFVQKLVEPLGLAS
jgi:hypothetical protein